MLAAQINAVLAEFTSRRVPFSHRDVAECIPDLSACQLDDVRQLVLEKMLGMPAYRLILAHFVGEGLTLLCVPCEAVPSSPPQIETPAVESGRLVA